MSENYLTCRIIDFTDEFYTSSNWSLEFGSEAFSLKFIFTKIGIDLP